MYRCTSRCVLTGSMLRFYIHVYQKKCIHECVPSYFIDIFFFYIIFYVNVHFCCCFLIRAQEIKLEMSSAFITVYVTKMSNL